jgi:hypothetical protein
VVKEAQLALKAFLEQPVSKAQQAPEVKQAQQVPVVFLEVKD